MNRAPRLSFDGITDADAARLAFIVSECGLVAVLLYAFQLHRLGTVGALELALIHCRQL
jgi:hypothetical protein